MFVHRIVECFLTKFFISTEKLFTCCFLLVIVQQLFFFLQNLMSLLTGPVRDLGQPCLQAVRTLTDYAHCLHSKIKSNQDPNLYTAKQGKSRFLFLLFWGSK